MQKFRQNSDRWSTSEALGRTNEAHPFLLMMILCRDYVTDIIAELFHFRGGCCKFEFFESLTIQIPNYSETMLKLEGVASFERVNVKLSFLFLMYCNCFKRSLTLCFIPSGYVRVAFTFKFNHLAKGTIKARVD